MAEEKTCRERESMNAQYHREGEDWMHAQKGELKVSRPEGLSVKEKVRAQHARGSVRGQCNRR